MHAYWAHHDFIYKVICLACIHTSWPCNVSELSLSHDRVLPPLGILPQDQFQLPQGQDLYIVLNVTYRPITIPSTRGKML